MYTCEVMLKEVLCLMKEAGKLAVLGSCHMFSDQYIDKEENSKIMVSPDLFALLLSLLNICQYLCTTACHTFPFQDVVLQWLMADNIQLNQIDAEDPEVRGCST